ncbi:MAG: LL-diaminopimelate aminotransferase [candidate division NC10 bacterium]|nr:LL-diaminopimelate aminotransferase [candidate division NC10 bacterium]
MNRPKGQARRLQALPTYLFAEIDRLKQEALKRGVDLIHLGIGDPDLPTPPHVVQRLAEAAADPANHQYPSYEGLLSFRQAVADWYLARFGVRLDAEREVLSLIGSKEGIGHVPLAFIDPGEVVLVPDPGYPVYQAGTVLAGGVPYFMPITKANAYLPDLKQIPPEILSRAKMIFLNYPNNPTAAVAPLEFFREAVDLAREYGLILCHDAAYSEICFDGYRPPSLLQVEGAKEVAVEFHSLSKTYNMTGWRIGFAVGNAEILSGLGRVKTNLDSGIFQAVQYAGIAALTGPQDSLEQSRLVFQGRRDALVRGLRHLGWEVDSPRASFYVWIPVPTGYTSAGFAALLLEQAGIVVTPGNGFGKHGEGFFRVALTVPESRIQEAIARIGKIDLGQQAGHP